jgi:hypothetical protein
MVDFHQLQQRLVALCQDGSDAPVTVVVVPSLTLHPDELKKIPGAVHFEQRLLFELQLLRDPRIRLVYVTSRRIDPSIVHYSLNLVAGLSRADAMARLTVLHCDDDSAEPLTGKILLRPDVLTRIGAATADRARSYLVVFNSTQLERELAVRLGVPLFACDPELAGLGTKSGGRRLLRDAGVPVLPGHEDLGSEEDLVAALARLKTEHPHLRKAVVKLNESFAGAGNAIFSYEGAPQKGLAAWIADRMADQLTAPGDTWVSFRDKLTVMGGVVEAFLDAQVLRSPSAQLEIEPGGRVRVLSTHDQVLSGAAGQTFVGCVFPAADAYRARVRDLAVQAGAALAHAGVIGQLSIDFVADEAAPEQVYALEINLRMGGATAPFMFTNALVNGHYDQTGRYLAPDGSPRHYVTSDRVQDDAFRSLSCVQLQEIAMRAGQSYQEATHTGVFFYALGALRDFGKLGVVAVGESREDAQQRYDAAVATLRAVAVLEREHAAVQ